MTGPGRRISLLVLICTALLSSALVVTWGIGNSQARVQHQQAIEAAAAAITRSCRHTTAALEAIAATDHAATTVTGDLAPDHPAVLDILRAIRAIIGAKIIYLMDPDGQTVACTPYQIDGTWATLTGHNYAFRPYFTGPMQAGVPAHDHALGVTTGERGFYQGVPIRQNGAVIGVAVAKRSLADIDAALASLPYPAALIDTDGIIFATNQPRWLFRATAPHDPRRLAQLRDSRRFADQPLEALDLDRADDQTTINGQRHLLHRHLVIEADWQLLALPPAAAPLDLGLLAAVTVLLGVLSGSTGAAVLFFRRQRAHLRRLLDGQHELAQSREQFALAVAGSNDGIWDWDLRSNTLFLSPRWKDQLGYADHEMPNVFASFKERIHPEDRPRVMALIQHYLRGEAQYYEAELRLRHKDGSWRWLPSRGP